MRIKEGYMLREAAGETVVVPFGEEALNFQGIISLNETGAFLWKLLEQGCEQDILVKALLNEYEIDAETANNDVKNFVEKVKKAGVLDA